MKKIILGLLLLTSFFINAQTKLQSPAEFLGYELGDRFTRHHRVVEYFKHIDDVASNVQVQQYGETYEHRPLIYAIIASPDNFKNIEQIRLDNLKRTGLAPGTPSTKVAIVWLSYNVHGNEANSMEAAMKTIYELVNPDNAKTKEWLKNTVIIMDPCINPDGRDRYANFFNQYGNLPANADPQAREHAEPWPRGRANHYLFDLNRDWAWQTQIESQARIKIYNQWMPHVHVDYHEQGYNSPYYFAPAAEPYHEVISNWQREFQNTIGKNNAKYFDEQGWLYFTKERFDLYYPSYGDSYPTYSGAIGMTYEKGGIGAGITITTKEGDPLTLKDRLTHHFTTGMATIETSSQNAIKLVDEFEKFFKENVNIPAAPFKTYVIKAENNPDKLKKLTNWLTSHGIQFGHAAASKPSRGFDFQTQSTNNFTLTTEDIVVNIYQPKGRFVTTIFEPVTKLTDSLTYDITAWNLMYAYDLKAFALNEKITVANGYEPKVVAQEAIAAKPYAYLFNYHSLNDVELLASLMKKGIKVRKAMKAFSTAGKNFEPGTLIVTRRNNEGITDFDNVVQNAAKSLGRKIHTTSTGYSDKGADFGSSEMSYIKAPKVALLGGDQTSSLDHGQVWHFFEQQLHYPLTIIGTDYFKNVDLWKYDVLIIPDGNYKLLDEGTLTMIERWTSDGGRLIAMAGANSSFADKKGFGLKVFANDDAKSKAEREAKEQKEKEGPVKYGDAERKELTNSIFGAIYKVNLDKSHPLAFGLGDFYYSLRTSELHYAYLEKGWNVGLLKGKQKPLIGFAGVKINRQLENTLVFGVEDKGKGQVVYLVDNPLFRSFWENGKMLFSNAVFMVGE
ncbi:MAG: M14 family metallopeptidase [Flammeovirgaceae bacterium]|nr:M14 family metallopeptidase [Flammeovirgaceae bacterium]